jgi:hypothetical protein
MWSMVRERLLDRLRTDEGVRAALPDVERSVRAGTLTPTLGADTLLAALAALTAHGGAHAMRRCAGQRRVGSRRAATAPVIGILHPGAMGAAVGNALKPVAGAVIWAAAGRSLTTSKRAETADLVGVPDVAELARRADVVISVCPPDAGAGGGRRRWRRCSPPRTALRGRQRGVARHGHRHRRAHRRRARRRRGDHRPARVGAGPHGRVVGRAPRRPPSPRSFAGSPFAAQVLAGPGGIGERAQGVLRVPEQGAAHAVGAARRRRRGVRGGRRDPRGAATARRRPRRQARGHRRAGQGQGLARGWGDAGGGPRRSPPWGLPDGFSRAAAETYERMAAADPTDRANPWGLRGPAER